MRIQTKKKKQKQEET